MTTKPEPTTTEPPKYLGLHKKLSLALDKVGRVPKRGQNQAQNYKYARADDVAEHTRAALAELGISITADVLEDGVREVEGKSGKIRITRVRIAWTFTDGETGDRMTVNIPGEGQDPGDKGIFKAMTGSMKYALMLNFLIPTGEGDAEFDGDEKEEQTHRPAPPQHRPSPEAAMADTIARHRLVVAKRIKDSGREWGAFLRAALGTPKTSDQWTVEDIKKLEAALVAAEDVKF